MNSKTDILIIGGGASGLACAIAARQTSNLSVFVLDRMNKFGKKLLVTGNGRCNLSNLNISKKFYHGSFDTEPILTEFSDIRPFFEKLGLYTVCDSAGRIYPLSNTAASVLDALSFAAQKYGIKIFTNSLCTDILPYEKGFLIKTEEAEISAKAVILASGGCAASVHGSDGSGFVLAKKLGIKITAPYPALCALRSDDAKGLEGLRNKCTASLFSGKALIKKECGEVQFIKNGLSGICIFNLSAAFGESEKNIKTALDLLPDFSFDEVYEMIHKASKNRNRAATCEIFDGIFNKKLALYLLKKSNIPLDNGLVGLGADALKRLSALAKNLEFNIEGRENFMSAQITAGGIHASQIDNRLMSKNINGLFFSGEIIDAWGDCGGYNLHFAFASGIKAGREAAKYVERKKNYDKNK